MAAPKLPPRQVRPNVPAFHPAPKPKPFVAPTIYRWGQSNPAYSKAAAAKAPAPAAAPPSAQVPSAPTSAVLPPDPGYDQQIGALGRARDTTLSGLAGQRTSGLLNYGYNENAAGGLAFDPTNPYSQAAQMKKRYDESRAGTANSMAARGQLYAGANQQSQDIINRGQGRSEDALMKSLIAFLAGNTGARGKAQTDYELGAGQAYGDRVARAPSNPLYSPTGDPAPAAAAPAASGGGIPDGTYTNKTAPPGLLAGNNKIAAGYVVVVRGGKVVDIRKQR